MVHKSIFILLFLFSTLNLFGQFDLNKHVLGPSVGFSFLGSTLQFGINHEYSIDLNNLGISSSGKLGVGGIFRYWKYSENFTHVDWDYTDILIGIQTNYHFYMSNENLDPWFGIIMAYDFGSSKSKIKTIGFLIGKETHGGFWVAANAGMRYWVKENIALSIRIGFGNLSYSALDLGFDYKFN